MNPLDVCPRCGQQAPVVYRGVNAFCTACGVRRMPLSSTSLGLAGQSSKVGGAVTGTIGWVILVLGLLAGFGTLGACGALVGFASAAPYVLGLPLIVLSAIVGWLLVRSGRELTVEGVRAQKTVRTQAVFGLANVRGGRLTSLDVAQSMGIGAAEADALLTSLAKEQPEHVSLEIDDQGAVYYRFIAAELRASHVPPTARAQAGVRVDPSAWQADPSGLEALAEEERLSEENQDSQRGRRRS